MEGAVTTRPEQMPRPRALGAATMCEAFQITAAERADQVALRTIGDGVAVTFAEYAERVRRIAGGLHALGIGSGDTVGLLLTNRPEFHLLDAAVMHLGATPFSIYNTSSPEQIAYLLHDAANRVLVVEATFLDRAREAMGQAGQVEHLVTVGAPAGEGVALSDLELGEAKPRFDFEAAWRRTGGPRGVDQRQDVLWPPAGDELTPTMKLKREPIGQKYAAEIEALYAR